MYDRGEGGPSGSTQPAVPSTSTPGTSAPALDNWVQPAQPVKGSESYTG